MGLGYRGKKNSERKRRGQEGGRQSGEEVRAGRIPLFFSLSLLSSSPPVLLSRSTLSCGSLTSWIAASDTDLPQWTSRGSSCSVPILGLSGRPTHCHCITMYRQSIYMSANGSIPSSTLQIKCFRPLHSTAICLHSPGDLPRASPGDPASSRQCHLESTRSDV